MQGIETHRYNNAPEYWNKKGLYNIKTYGILFYGINSHYAMWCESWTETVDGLDKYNEGLRTGLYPKGMATGLISYLQIHGAMHSVERMMGGIKSFQSVLLNMSFDHHISVLLLLFCKTFKFMINKP